MESVKCAMGGFLEMTDDKGAGDWPYRIKNKNYWWHVDGLGEEQRLNQWAYKIGAEWWARQLNTAHAEGRKAERERCLEIARGYSSCEGIAQRIAKEIEEAQDEK